MKIFLLAPNFCWHTEDLLKLKKYSKRLDYIFVSDTPIFLSRRVYKKYFHLLNVSYEFWQRLWRIIFCIPWGLYLKIKLSGQRLVHCHGLFSLVIAQIAGISNKRIIFTPQGSDILVLPDKNFFVRKFLSYKLEKISFITADSSLLLKKALLLSPKLKKHKLKIIQNGIPLADIERLICEKGNLKERSIDICWIRGLSEIYQFEYFLELLKRISKLSKSEINVHIISAFGKVNLPIELQRNKNINIKLLPRLNSIDFLNTLLNSKVVISIPKSDSSPRSVYEAINLGCNIFATNLECFEWIPTRLKSEFTFSTENIEKDSTNILSLINKFKRRDFDISYKDIFPNFYRDLDYKNIANTYSRLFEKIQNS